MNDEAVDEALDATRSFIEAFTSLATEAAIIAVTTIRARNAVWGIATLPEELMWDDVHWRVEEEEP